MAAQLPPDVVGAAAGVLVYSFICLASGMFLMWLVWIHDERKSYVAMMVYFGCLHTVTSIIQQIHAIVRWRDIKLEQYEILVANVGDPELNIAGPSTELDLVLFYIRYYAYNVESLLILFWAVELANSIFQLRITRIYRVNASIYAKAVAVILPAAQMVLLRFSGVKRSTMGFMALADVIIIGCFAAGSLILLAILVRYIHSRITLASWNVRYGQSGSGTRSGASGVRPPKQTIYDKWLVLRFSVAFVALSLFQMVVLNFQLRAAASNDRSNLPPEPDLSSGQARTDFALFIPGPTAVLFFFLVFGTTRTFREYMWGRFVPRSIREKVEARQRRKREIGASVSVVHSATGDVGVGNAGILLEVQHRGGVKEGDGKSDEWPILKSTSLQQARGQGYERS
ncbi:hypothetical protein VTI74DRAFT_1800 [Chaetomium olivicolor]